MDINYEKTLAHVLRDGGEFRLLALELADLAVDHPVLVIDLGKQGGKFLVNLALLRMLEVDGIHRAQDAL